MTFSGKVIATTIAAAEIFIIASAFGGGYLFARDKFEPDAIKLKARVDSVTLQLEASNQKVIATKKYADSITKAENIILASIKPRVDTLWKQLEENTHDGEDSAIIENLKKDYASEMVGYNTIISVKDSVIDEMTTAAQIKDSTITSLVAENTALQTQVTRLNEKLKTQGKLTKILGAISLAGIGYAIIRR